VKSWFNGLGSEGDKSSLPTSFSPSVLLGLLNLNWFGRATYSWVKEEDIQDFIQLFDIHANQKCQNFKRRKIDLDKKIKLALNAIPDFRPKGWLSDSDFVPELPVHDVITPEEPCVVCNSLDDEDKCLICDNCNMCLHYFCIGLAAIPDGAWICPWCAQGHILKSIEVFR
jgi:hypothetical protein